MGTDRIEYKSGWNPDGVIELFVSLAAVCAGSLIIDLHKYNKELQLRNQGDVKSERANEPQYD